jgi:Fur family transcriptional regulator, ferric uptake regulator
MVGGESLAPKPAFQLEKSQLMSEDPSPAVKAAHDLTRLIRDAGLRVTPIRLEVLTVLIHAGRPLSVAQMIPLLPAYAGTVTVYRTLHSFLEKGVVHKVRGDDREWNYAFGAKTDLSKHQHPHFVCDDCGMVECLSDAQLPDSFVAKLKQNARFEIGHVELFLHGKCQPCSESKSRRSTKSKGDKKLKVLP